MECHAGEARLVGFWFEDGYIIRSSMATCTTDGIGGVQWSSSRTTFHRNKGENVKLTERKSVATRIKDSGYAIVFTSEPMVAGQMLKVNMMGREDRWWRGGGGMVRAY